MTTEEKKKILLQIDPGTVLVLGEIPGVAAVKVRDGHHAMIVNAGFRDFEYPYEHISCEATKMFEALTNDQPAPFSIFSVSIDFD